ncbi:hypothetical protein [Alteromonas australica]|uniref:hypothetical protein n=1 Tax=Alteromonas australica TaxID=589873 RepID=UPI002357F64C|nr:hypothetical protein [Alteromonas australica]|tara:strand:- start:32902 stop:36201 length:3300 start_codon:yes stop_codon:yes gene_type:complete
MPKAIVVAVGDTPLNPLNDLLKQNSISSNVIDAAAHSLDDIDKLIKKDGHQCVLLKGISSSELLSRLAGTAESLVLLYCSPTTALGDALEVSNGSVKPQQMINHWQESVSQAMELVEEDDSYSLCDLNNILAHPSLFLAEFFAIEKAAESKASKYTKKLFASHLATLHLFEQDDAFTLYDDALSIGKLFGEFTVHLSPETEELKSNAESVGKSVLEKLSVNHREIQTKSSQIQELQQQLNDTHSKQSEIQASVEKLEAEKNNAEEVLVQTTKTHEDRVKELETQLESLKDIKLAFEKNIADLAEQLGQSRTLNKQQSEKLESLLAQQALLIEAKEKQLSELNACAEDNRRIMAEREAATKQLEQTNSENKKLSQGKVAIEEQYQNVTEKLSEANKRIAELDHFPAKLTSLSQEYELAGLQIAQLQEELESTVVKISVLSPLPEKLSKAQATIQKYEVKVEELSSENTLSEIQVAQLQEELEVTLVELSKQQTLAKRLNEQTKISEKLDKGNNQLQSEKNAVESEIVRLQKESEQLVKKNTELEYKCKSLTQQIDAATQSQSKKSQALIGDLQSQLEEKLKRNEQIMELKSKLESQLKELQADMTNNKDFHQAELELASLQISQLQEELEYYYHAYQEAQNKGGSVTIMANQRQKVFSKAMAAGMKVIGKYADDGYQDIHFLLSDVRLGCGKEYAELPVKLANVGGHIAVEFRDSSGGTLFQHFDDTTDEYGPFLRFFANPSAERAEQQKMVYSRMNASERVLVVSTIMLLAELLQSQSIECEVQVDASEWRRWRLAAIELLEASENLPVWLSFDRVVLKEEFQTNGYEHLWLVFENVLVGDNWQEKLELKVAASNVSGGEQPFSSEIVLEFRTLEDGTPPLLSWPPETADEYGHKFLVQLGDLNSLTDLATPDRNLIKHLVNNLSSIIEKVEEQHAVMQRPKNDWVTAIDALIKESQPAAEVEEQLIPEALFSVNEVVSLGSYQHVQFSQTNDNTKVKLKAQNINPDSFDAELFVELRNGEPDVIYHNTEFYGEDEYGPRVQIPAEALFTEIATEREAEFSWLLETYAKVRSELESTSEVEELVKRLWVNMLNRKQSIL